MDPLDKYHHVDLLFPSNYVKAVDFGGKPVTITIDRIDPRAELKMQGGKKDWKPVVYARGGKKGWILNKTNARAIAKVYGPEVKGWIGKRVVLREQTVEAHGEMVPAIRVDVEATRRVAGDDGRKAPPPPPPPPPPEPPPEQEVMPWEGKVPPEEENG